MYAPVPAAMMSKMATAEMTRFVTFQPLSRVFYPDSPAR
jgi:hypothetical protein